MFVLPGFVTLLIRERTYTVPSEQKPFERLLRALYYAAIVYAVALGLGALVGVDKASLVDLYNGRKSLGAQVSAAVLVVLVLPLCVAEAGRHWRRSSLRATTLERLRISAGHDVDSGWNKVFSSAPNAMFVRSPRSTDGFSEACSRPAAWRDTASRHRICTSFSAGNWTETIGFENPLRARWACGCRRITSLPSSSTGSARMVRADFDRPEA